MCTQDLLQFNTIICPILHIGDLNRNLSHINVLVPTHSGTLKEISINVIH